MSGDKTGCLSPPPLPPGGLTAGQGSSGESSHQCMMGCGLNPSQALFSSSIPLQLSSIKTLTGSNFDEWLGSLSVFLGVMNLDLSLRVDPPPVPTPLSSFKDTYYYLMWEHSNRNCLMIMSYTVDKAIRNNVPRTDNARDYLDSIKKQFAKFDKAILIQEEQILKVGRSQSALLVVQGSSNNVEKNFSKIGPNKRSFKKKNPARTSSHLGSTSTTSGAQKPKLFRRKYHLYRMFGHRRVGCKEYAYRRLIERNIDKQSKAK
ncbi:hypothetical protein PTKIN_Ptkin14bG0103200 [Pterospermum kingtungense]